MWEQNTKQSLGSAFLNTSKQLNGFNFENKERKCIAIDAFVKLAKKRNYNVTYCSHYESIYLCKDIRLTRGKYDQEELWINVQPSQNIYGDDSNVHFGFHWIQLHGFRSVDDLGWLIAGQSDFIAFEQKDGFFLIPRKQLWEYTDIHIPKTEFTIDQVFFLESAIHKMCPIHKRVKAKNYEIFSLVPMESLKKQVNFQFWS